MSSLALQILQEATARVNGAPLGPLAKPTGLGVQLCRLREIKPGALPFVSLYPMEGATQRKGFLAESTLLLKVAIDVKGGEVEVQEAIDAVYLWVFQQLMAEESLGGLALKIEPVQQVWGFALHMQPYGDLDCHFLITYRHHATNPSLPG